MSLLPPTLSTSVHSVYLVQLALGSHLPRQHTQPYPSHHATHKKTQPTTPAHASLDARQQTLQGPEVVPISLFGLFGLDSDLYSADFRLQLAGVRGDQV